MKEKSGCTVKIDESKCIGCISCMRKCPSKAIHVQDGKAKIRYEKCIGCGNCIRGCKVGAISSEYDSIETIKTSEYKFKVALPHPSLYGQFNNLDNVDIVLTSLLALGFDDVFEVAAGAELVSEATRAMMREGKLQPPQISTACPAIVEMIMIRFHNLKDNLLPLLSPVNASAKLARELAIKKTGYKSEEIGIFFISPCPSHYFSAKNSIGVDKSDIDVVLSQTEMYFPLLKEMNKNNMPQRLKKSGYLGVGFAASGGEASGVHIDRYLSCDGMDNCISILKEVEDDKLQNIHFIELNACPGGCVGGVNSVENPFVAKAKIHNLRRLMPHVGARLVDYEKGEEDMLATAPYETSDVYKFSDNMLEAMQIMSRIMEIESWLGGHDCGICGSPTCRAFAEDVVLRGVDIRTCVRITE